MSTLYVDNLQPNLGSQVEIPDLKPNAESIINTQRFVQTAFHDHGSSSYVDAITWTYTPVSATSKVIFQTSFWGRGYRNGGADCRWRYRILVNDTTKAESIYVGVYDYGSHGVWANNTWTDYIEFDSISTAAITLKVQTAVQGGLGVRVSENGNPSTLLVTEIAQ